jgi:DNA polymerase
MGWSTFQASLRVGFLGMPPLLFDEAAATKLGADIDVFCMSRSYKKGFAFLRDEALAMKPLNVGEREHLWHCAAVKKIVDGYRQSNPEIVASWKEAGHALDYIIAGERVKVGKRCEVYTCPEGFELPNGMKILYNKLRKTKGGEHKYLANVKRKEWAYIYAGKCVENLIQALSRILIAEHMLKVDECLKERSRQDPGKIYKIITSTHDEILCCVPTQQAQWCLDMMGEVMATPCSWCPDLPLKSAGGFARSYGDCEK